MTAGRRIWSAFSRACRAPADIAATLRCRRREQVHPARFVILDDLFPNLASGFRVAEYNYLLERIPGAEVLSANRTFDFAGARGFGEAHRGYAKLYPHLAARVTDWSPSVPPSASGVYCLFLNNILRYLPAIERSGAGFVFTLYPGGGFRMNDAVVDAGLKRVFASQGFRHVIVTQNATRKYLLEKCLCPEDRMTLILGNPVAPDELGQPAATLEWEAAGPWNLCFVAHKYTPAGRDKGYDRFVRMAQILTERKRDVAFHVVGNFEQADVALRCAGKRFQFHGPRPFTWLRDFFSRMHAIVSPNIPFVLAPGAFDGFPTASCVSAALAGVAVFCTDCLAENTRFVDGQDLVIVPPEPDAMCDVIDRWLSDRDRLRAIADAGAKAFRAAYSIDRQLVPRLDTLKRCGASF